MRKRHALGIRPAKADLLTMFVDGERTAEAVLTRLAWDAIPAFQVSTLAGYL